MTLVMIHAVVYLVANAGLVFLWLMLGGSAEHLGDPLTAARSEGFWPLWIIGLWGALLALHAGITLPVAMKLRGRRRRRRARQESPAAPAEGRQWMAAMFTDICGSSALASEVGDEAWAEIVTRHRDVVRRTMREHGGEEIGTQGDGFLLRFADPSSAVECAIALQEAFAEERASDGQSPRVRIGIHAGEAVARDEDVLGRMVNLAARVADRAEADEILVTEPVADHSRPGVAFEDRGLQTLKGAAGPRHVLAVRRGATSS